jgi:hypothetical protein
MTETLAYQRTAVDYPVIFLTVKPGKFMQNSSSNGYICPETEFRPEDKINKICAEKLHFLGNHTILIAHRPAVCS